MALFTDPDVITLDDLLQFETSLTQVATVHGIDLPTKIRIATNRVGDRLLLGLLRSGLYDPVCAYGRNITLNSILVTPPLQRWLCFDTLSRVFAEAYNVQLNTRFEGKRTEYQKESEEAANLVFATGLPVVLKPLPKPGLPSIVTGLGTITAPAVFVQTTWVDGLGNESATSDVSGSVLNGFSTVQVSIANSAKQIPNNASGWNVYASLTQQNLTLQNFQPLPVNATWQMPVGGLQNGLAPTGGQKADFIAALSYRILRG